MSDYQPPRGEGPTSTATHRGLHIGLALVLVVFLVAAAVLVARALSLSPDSTGDATADRGRGTTGCVADPSDCGYPDADNTGPSIPVSSMKAVPEDVKSGNGWHYDPRGWIQVDGNGAVVEGITTRATINIAASNVTVTNNRIQIMGEGWGVGLSSGDNIVVSDNDIYSPVGEGDKRMLVAIKDIYSTVTGVTVSRNDIWHAGTGIQMDAGVISDNFIHDMGYRAGDHLNGILSTGGSQPLVIRHNTVFNNHNQTDAIGLFQDFSPQENRTITDNLLGGGGYTIYGGANPGKESGARNIVITDNRFSQQFHERGGYWGPVAYFHSGGGNVWEGNYWDESGETVGP